MWLAFHTHVAGAVYLLCALWASTRATQPLCWGKLPDRITEVREDLKKWVMPVDLRGRSHESQFHVLENPKENSFEKWRCWWRSCAVLLLSSFWIFLKIVGVGAWKDWIEGLSTLGKTEFSKHVLGLLSWPISDFKLLKRVFFLNS